MLDYKEKTKSQIMQWSLILSETYLVCNIIDFILVVSVDYLDYQ